MSMYGFLYIVTGCDHMRVSFFPDTVRFEKSPCCFCQYSDPHMKYFFHLTTALSHGNLKKQYGIRTGSMQRWRSQPRGACHRDSSHLLSCGRVYLSLCPSYEPHPGSEKTADIYRHPGRTYLRW